MMELLADSISVGYDKHIVLNGITLHLRQGEIVCILGPNGIGKTTVFRSIMGFIKLIEGVILLDGVPRDRLSDHDFSKAVGYVPQSQELFFPFSVLDVVVMGCVSQLRLFQSPGVKEYKNAERILETLGILHLRNKKITNISGGERQMVLIAKALAQKPKLLVMDEPTANLDFRNQIKVMKCITELSSLGIGVLMTTHNPDHAFLCCDRVLLLTKDREALCGTADDIVTEENLLKAYGVKVRIVSSVGSDGKEVKCCIPML